MSETPEEQPSTGVLGRIGSWFSPWRGKSPKSPSENASPTSDQVFKLDGEEEEGEEFVSAKGEPQEQEENQQISRNIFFCEGEDATQSAHRDDSTASSTETAGGGPNEEESVGCRKKGTRQGEEREESSNGTSESGNPEKNASHLTHLSSPSEQGVLQDSGRALRQVQAQTGKRLHVYLEETSVIHRGNDAGAGQEVVTKVKTSLQVLPKAKSSESFELPRSAENKRTYVTPPTDGAQSYYSALVGVSLKSHKDSQLEPEPDQKQTEEDESMGRKNSAKRRYRKNSQGDGATSPLQEKQPPSAATEGFPSSDKTVTSPQGKSPNTHMGELSVNSSSSSKHNPSSQASPEGGEGKTAVTQLDDFQDSNSTVAAATVVSAMDGGADMEDDDSLYKVERKTETPESKRRSLKVSRSEVKFFPKNVPLKSTQSAASETQNLKLKLKNTRDEAKDKAKTETDSRQHNLKKIDEESKPVAARIADKISLFEHPAGGVSKLTFKTPRSADVSPVRTATEQLKANFSSLDQRSRSAERYNPARSSSASPVREKTMTIKERMKNLAEASKIGERPALPQKPVMTRMPQKSTSKSPELDNQDKRDVKEQKQTDAKTEITSQPDGQDVTDAGVKISTAKDKQTESKTKDMVDQSTKTADDAELNLSLSPQSKGRTRSKRRKSREPTSPLSPNSEHKLDSTAKPEVTTLKPEGTKAAAASKEKPSDKQKLIKHDIQESDKQKKQLDSSFKTEEKDKLMRQEGLAEPSVSKKEPDTDASSSETKTAIDKESVILTKKEEREGGLSTQKGEKAAEDSREMLTSSSPASKGPIKKEPPVEHSKLNKDLSVQSELKSKGKVKESNREETDQKPESKSKDLKLIKQTESKDVGILEKDGTEKAKQTESKENYKLETGREEKTQQVNKEKGQIESNISKKVDRNEGEDLEKVQRGQKNRIITKDKEKIQHSDRNITKPEVLGGRQGFPGKDGAFVVKDESKKETRLIQDTVKPETKQREETSGKTSKVPAQTHEGQNKSTYTQKAGDATVTHTSGAASISKSDKDPLKEETETNVQKNSSESSGKDTEPGLTTKLNSVPMEKSENSLHDSCAHGPNDATSSSPKPITRAATADEEVTTKASNDTPALITERADTIGEKETTLIIPNLNFVSESVSSEREGKDSREKSLAVKLVPSEEKISGDDAKHSQKHPLGEESKNTESTRDVTPLKGSEKKAQMSSGSPLSNSTVNVVQNTAEKTIPTPKTDPVANGKAITVTKQPFDMKLSQTSKAPISPEIKKQVQDLTQRSPVKKPQFPRGLSKDDSSSQDAPSSWLDVDVPKRKLRVSIPKLTSAGSESNLLDTPDDLDDDDFVERIKKLCAPFSLPPRKHNPFGPPQPPFAMPAIKEDRFEKTFDPEEFKFGLRKKKKFTIDSSPSTLAKLEEKPGPKVARASLADRSLLLSSLDTHSRLREKTPVNDDEDAKEEKDDQIKRKSRLEGSCVLSSLSSSILRGKRFQAQAEGTNSGEVSPSESPQSSSPPSSQPPPPSPTAAAPLTDTVARQSPAPSNKEEAQAGEAVVSDSAPPLPSFNDIKLPDYLEKYLPREVKPEQNKQGQEQIRAEANGRMKAPASVVESDMTTKPVSGLSDAVPPRFPGIPPPTHSALPELKQPLAQPQRMLNNIKRTPKGFHKRPGKMVLFEKAQFSGQAFEIYRDLADATSMQLSPLISVKVVRGCWVLYEKPNFQGRCIALEEGGIELANMWAEPEPGTDPQNDPPMRIGSIRLAVSDYSLPHIDLFTEPEGRGRVTPYHDDTIETGSFGIPLNTASIQVHSGVWLVFSDPGFQGMVTVLETGVYPFPETWGFPSPFVGSIRPLKIGGFKVENPSEVKAVVYEKPGFEGSCFEFDNDVFSFCESEEDGAADGVNPDTKKIKSVGSLKIIGGLWVGYSHPGFEGQQFILEEGEYLNCSEWGGSEQLLSLRPILADFLSPHLKMYSDRNFGELGVNIDLTVPVINMDDTGYGTKTQSIDVVSGVWVVFEEPGFCGESYILEKGLYGNPEDWGAVQSRVASAMPVVLDDFENAAKFKVQLFSDPGFQGTVLVLEDSVASLQDGFSVASCKVLAGSWLAFEAQDFGGRMYVLEVGNYPDLRAMGCFNTSASILSLQITGFEFSLPSITVFERVGLRGKRVVLTDGSVNLQLAGGCSRVQSVLVEGGMWVLYEEINYRGAQILLKPGEISDWRQICNWRKIGSLRPLLQKQVHFRIRNRQTKLMMSLTGDLDDVKLMRIQETEETDGFEQIWFYQNGHVHCKMLEECCLCPSGSVTMAGSRVGLTPELQNQVHLWSITPEGFIRYSPMPDLVLEVKGGHNYDKNQVILNTLDPHKPQQRWDVEII